MPILTADSLHKSFGTRTIFDDISFSVEEGEKVGFVGPNGSGKSTLFKILAGMEPADRGALAVRRGATVGYLAQEPSFEADDTILTAVAAGRPELVSAMDEYHRVAAQLADSPADPERLLARQGQLMSRIDDLGGWGWQHEVETVLTQLGIDQWERRVEGLSGGERKRIALGRVLLDGPDILLLDEPTNHLDADTTLWLEDRLLEYPGAVLLVTHDRYFLDRVVMRILEITPGEFVSHLGGYTEYLESKARRQELAAAEAEKRDRLMEQELAWVKRSPAARTGKQKARINRLEALREEAAADPGAPPELDMRFGAPPRLGRTVLELDGVTRKLGDRVLIQPLSTILRAGERIGIIGPNGAGKTTLLRIIIGEETPDSGTVRLGLNTRIAYFDQSRTDLDPSLSVYDTVASEEWLMYGGRRVHARSYLETFLFPSRTHELRVGSLSGGERNRLLLAKLMLTDANLLILDEPTNDLDLPTLQVLENALVDFAGSVLVVSHDRFFLDKVATGLLVFEKGGTVHRHEGGYDLYRRLLEQRDPKPGAAPRKPTKEPARAAATGTRGLSYREKKELDGMEVAIMEAEAARDELAGRLADPALYVDTPQKIAALRRDFEAAEARVAELFSRWAELDAESAG